MTHSHASESVPQEPKDFWEQRYAESVARSRGKAGKLIQRFVPGLRPGRVLELGCSTGDDSLWLAEQGWQVTAVDISDYAVATARRLADEAGLADKIRFQACDLTETFPVGEFELVCAMFFQSPYADFPRIGILQTAASRIVSGGHLLMVTHATGAPWGKQPHPEMEFPTAVGDWQELALPESEWRLEELGVLARIAIGPQGQEAEIQDNLIFAQRV